MKAKDTSALFEATRRAPVELSKEIVMDFIKVIPTLPPPSSNWFQNFNLNSIIMTTTAITLVTSAVLYFSINTDKQELVLPAETEFTAPMPIGIIDEFEESGQTKLVITTIDTVSKKAQLVAQRASK